MPPTISVLLPIYNSASYLREAIGSVLAQTCGDFELVAVDDGSTDDSKKIVEAFAAQDARVRLISRPNTGIVGALNDAIAAAQGEFFARMDNDDRAHPTRFEQQLAFLRSHPSCVVVGSAARMIDPAGRLLKVYRPRLDPAGILADALAGNGAALLHPTIFIRGAAVRKVGGYEERFRSCEDLDLYLRLSEIGELANLAEPLLDYRVHHASYNHKRTAKQRELVLEATNAGRQRHALPPLTELPHAVPAAQDKADSHLRWAGWALEEENAGVALLHAWKAFLLAPTQKRTRQFLRYAVGRRLKQPKSRGETSRSTSARP